MFQLRGWNEQNDSGGEVNKTQTRTHHPTNTFLTGPIHGKLEKTATCSWNDRELTIQNQADWCKEVEWVIVTDTWDGENGGPWLHEAHNRETQDKSFRYVYFSKNWVLTHIGAIHESFHLNNLQRLTFGGALWPNQQSTASLCKRCPMSSCSRSSVVALFFTLRLVLSCREGGLAGSNTSGV